MANSMDLLDKDYVRTAPQEVSNAIDETLGMDMIGFINKNGKKVSFLDNEEMLKTQDLLNRIDKDKNVPFERPEHEDKESENKQYLKELLQGQEMSCIKGLDKYQYKQLLNNMCFADFHYSLFNKGDGSFDFYFPQNKAKECFLAFTKSNYELSGKDGNLRKEIIDLEESVKYKIEKNIEKDKKEWSLADSQSGLVLVVNKDNFDVYKDGKQVEQEPNERGERLPFRTSKQDPNFKENLKRATKLFIHPVLFEKNEVNLLMEKTKIMELTREKDKTSLRKKRLYDLEKEKDEKERELEKEIWENISNKMAVTEKVPQYETLNLYNHEESYKSYDEKNDINKEIYNDSIDDKIKETVDKMKNISISTVFVNRENTFNSLIKEVRDRANEQEITDYQNTKDYFEAQKQ